MICPRQDGELILKTVPQPGDTLLEYEVCTTCKGVWLRAFDANFLKSTDIETTNNPISVGKVASQSDLLICPSCGYKLVRTTGANIPENVLAFRCPNRHGYYFPSGELSKFKVAQETNIAYHRTWNIPLTSIAATLLMSFLGVILSAGLILGVVGGQQQQNIVSQAENLITFQKAYVSAENKSVTFIAATSVPTTLTLHIREMNYTNTLQSTDSKSHVIRVTNISSGKYTYYFSFDVDDKNIHTEDFAFVMP